MLAQHSGIRRVEMNFVEGCSAANRNGFFLSAAARLADEVQSIFSKTRGKLTDGKAQRLRLNKKRTKLERQNISQNPESKDVLLRDENSTRAEFSESEHTNSREQVERFSGDFRFRSVKMPLVTRKVDDSYRFSELMRKLCLSISYWS